MTDLRGRLAAILEIHHFVERDLYFEDCMCRCGQVFDFRNHPVSHWSRHVADLLYETVKVCDQNRLHPEPLG